MKLKTPGTRGWLFVLITTVVAFGLPYVLPVEHHGGFWEKIPGWWLWFGGVGCAVIVVVSKWLGSIGLNKPEDWYE